MIKNKFLKWTFVVILALVALVVLVLVGFSLGEKVMFFDFYKDAEKEIAIPGLNEGYVPQGFDYIEEKELYLACGYMANGEASRMYVIDKDGKATYSRMKNADGSGYHGHAGGIDHLGDYVYVSSDGSYDLFLLSDVLDGDGSATVVKTVNVFNDPAFCEIKDGYLYLGTYYYPEKYETPKNYHFTTPAGDYNTAIMTVYKLDEATGELASDLPEKIYSIPGMVQGMTFADDDTMILVTSWGLSKSHLYFYDLEKAEFQAKTTTPRAFDVNGTSYNVVFLDSASLIADVVAPPMAEEILVRDGRVYVMNESASNKYIFGKLTTGSHVYSYPVK